MKSWEVPDQWLCAAVDAWRNAPDGEKFSTAIAAVAPMIAKAERERILGVLRAHETGYAKSRASYQAANNNEMTAFVGGKETALGVAIHAIRALGEADD